MAAGSVSRDIRESDNDKALIKCTWILTSADPTGATIAIPDFNDKNWTIGAASGDAFGGATCALQGSHVLGDTLVTLNKAAGGNPATTVAAAIINTIENTLFVAPVRTSPGTLATITVTLLARRANVLRN